MLLEETPSGNLRLVSPANPEAGVRLTRGDVNCLVNVFELLDRWAREACPDGSDHDS
ncbi:MAG: hypothetical protein HYS27_17105 [Deltaproteobacteria bacterium]|nr:hypothetical protein [Deltaproteobacteria bacterium]